MNGISHQNIGWFIVTVFNVFATQKTQKQSIYPNNKQSTTPAYIPRHGRMSCIPQYYPKALQATGQQCFWAHPRNKEWKVRCVSQAAQGQSSQLSPWFFWPLCFTSTKAMCICIYPTYITYMHIYIYIRIYIIIYIYVHMYIEYTIYADGYT